MPCLQDVPEDDLLVIIKSITKRYTGIENKTQYLPTASKMHIQKMQLINSLREEKIIPELIQNEMTSKKILPPLLEYLSPSSKKRKETIEKYKNIRTKLGPPGVFDRAAKHIISKNDNEK